MTTTLTTTTLAGVAVQVNEEGFFEDPKVWTPAMAEEMAKADKEFFEKGTGPTVRVLGKTSGVSVKDLYLLFPKGPAKMAARLAGIPKPKGCI